MPDILIYGIVGDEWDGLDAKTIVLAVSQAEGDLNVRINSPGGYVMEGLAIYNALIRAKAAGIRVTCHIDGLAASMASVIAMAGDDIVMADNALMMIHNPWDCACGDANELRAAADQLDRLRDQIVGIYAKQTGLATDDLVTLLNAETWLTSAQALDQKFVTQVASASTAAACDVTAFGFRKTPETPRISAMAMIGKPKAATAVPHRPQEKPMDLYKTRAELVTAIAKFQKDGGTQAEIDKIGASALALNAQDALPATGALAIHPSPVTTATSTAALTQADITSAVAAERSRVSGIRALGTKHKLDGAFIDGLVASDTTLAVAREKILDKLAEQSDAQNIGHTQIQVTGDARDKWMSGAAAWLLTRAGVAGMVAQAAAKKGEKIDLNPGEFRGVSCVELARESLMHSGVRLASRDPKAIVGAAFTARGDIGGMQTTGDFPLLLENALHKTVQASYAVTPDTWSLFCHVGTITDFRPHPRYMLGTFSALDPVNEAGEFRNKALPDGARESITGGTKGNIVAISRQAIINDDMGVFSGIAVDLGRAAKLTIEKDVYALLAQNGGLGPIMSDGKTFFHADHGNLAAAGSPPTAASLDAARMAMASQMDISGNDFLDVRPAIWLGPLTLGSNVRTTIRSQYDPDAVNKLQRPNPVQNLVDTIVDTPRLTGTAWDLFADKDTNPALEVAFLNGVQEPYLDSEQGWRVDGTEWKVREDYGVGAINYRSAYRNPGA